MNRKLLLVPFLLLASCSSPQEDLSISEESFISSSEELSSSTTETTDSIEEISEKPFEEVKEYVDGDPITDEEINSITHQDVDIRKEKSKVLYRDFYVKRYVITEAVFTKNGTTERESYTVTREYSTITYHAKEEIVEVELTGEIYQEGYYNDEPIMIRGEGLAHKYGNKWITDKDEKYPLDKDVEIDLSSSFIFGDEADLYVEELLRIFSWDYPFADYYYDIDKYLYLDGDINKGTFEIGLPYHESLTKDDTYGIIKDRRFYEDYLLREDAFSIRVDNGGNGYFLLDSKSLYYYL